MTSEIPSEVPESSEISGVSPVQLSEVEQSMLAFGDPNSAAFHALMLDKGIQPGVAVEVTVGDKSMGPYVFDEKGRWKPHSPEIAGHKEVSEETLDELGDKGFNLTGPENPSEAGEWVQQPTMFPETTRMAIYMENGVEKREPFVGIGQRKSGNVALVKPAGFDGPYKEIPIEGGVFLGQYDTAEDEKKWGPRKDGESLADVMSKPTPEQEEAADMAAETDIPYRMLQGMSSRDRIELQSYATADAGLMRRPEDAALIDIKNQNWKRMSAEAKNIAAKYSAAVNAKKVA
jgi:hypothetical protein